MRSPWKKAGFFLGILGSASVWALGENPGNASVPMTVSNSQTAMTVSSSQGAAESSLSDQMAQLHSVVDALVQSQVQQKNELTLLQRRVLQLEAENELSRSKLIEANPVPLEPINNSETEPATSNDGHESLYLKAYTLINQGEYQKAKSSLKAYLLAEPSGAYASNAHYWLGEIAMVNAQSDVAAKEFRVVIDSFPKSERAAAATRELGEIFLTNGDSQHAKQMLQKVVQDYPDTASAVLAKKTLETM